jgi:UTP:GlnB (protein PII) uridylyltransferase
MKLDLSKLAPESLRSGEFEDIFPEFYKLKNVIENNAWHKQQSVFDHSLKALQAFDDYFLINPELKSNFAKYDLLRVAVLFHDIGKLKALYEKNGKTTAPSHGPIGGWIVAPILQKAGFSSDEVAYVASLVTDHILVCDLLELSVNLKEKSIIEMLKIHRPEIWRDLLLIAYADISGCDTDEETIIFETRERLLLIEKLIR